MSPDRPVLEIDAVTVRFGTVVAVDGVTLAVGAGRTLGVIGPNGAGKTTLLNAVNGLIPLRSGTVRLGGAEVTRLAPAARARRGLGRTFQTPQLLGGLTAARSVGLVPRRRGGVDVPTALRMVGLGEHADLPGNRLTASERRLLELARCLPLAPAVVLLDEPGTGLRESDVTRFVEVVDRLRGELGVAFVLVDHNMALVSAVCEEVAVLDRGRHVTTASPEVVARDPAVIEAYFGAPVLEEDPA